MIVGENIFYSSKKHNILKQIKVAASEGELLGIIGPNGAGKSTLLGLLAHENKPTSGEVYFDKKAFAQWEAGTLARRKAKFSQENSGDIGLEVKDIVLMGRYPYFDAKPNDEDWQVVDEMMEKTDVYRFKDRNYTTLSGGEKQRVHLARVLAQLHNDENRNLAFFDEPLNNLDVRYQFQIMEEIKQFTQKGNTAVLILHDLNLAAEFADNILLLKKGEVLAYGKPKDILCKELIAKAYDFPCNISVNPITGRPMVIFCRNRMACKINKPMTVAGECEL